MLYNLPKVTQVVGLRLKSRQSRSRVHALASILSWKEQPIQEREMKMLY